MRVFSGVQPSGKLHLGNYFSMMKRMVEYQKSSELYCFIASYHAMTTVTDAKELSENIFQTAVDFLSVGIDPSKSVFWVQSDVPEVTELSWLLSTSITVPQLELAHSYKDKIAQGMIPSTGLFTYPVLMAADILAFGGQKVPVGKDQKQHLEITRDIARKFNNDYGETFIIPEPDIIADVATIPGVDGRKMSKSYKNAIYFFAEEKDLKKSVMSIVTDSKGVEEKKDFAGTPLYEIYSLFLDDEGKKSLQDRFTTPGTGYGHIKLSLFEAILEHFAPYRKKRSEFLARPNDVRDILADGAKKARVIAQEFVGKARKNVGLYY